MWTRFKCWIFRYFPHTLLITKIKRRRKFNSGSSSRDAINSKTFFGIAKRELIIRVCNKLCMTKVQTLYDHKKWPKNFGYENRKWNFKKFVNRKWAGKFRFLFICSTYKAISSSLISLTSHPQFGSPSHAGPPMAPSNLQYAPVHS